MSQSESEYVLEPVEASTIPVVGSGQDFTVRRIWCVGRNFADHAKEMGHDPNREPPFFFSKPSDAVVVDGGELDFPTQTQNLHHEIELAVAIGRRGRDVSIEDARSLVFGYAVALDMTRRDLQDDAKRLSRPWAIAKGFDESCPISKITPASAAGTVQTGQIELHVNGDLRQAGDLAQMIWSIEECISILSSYVELRSGDLLLTGTPAGVGPVLPGDQLDGMVEGIGELSVCYRPKGSTPSVSSGVA